MNIRGIIFIYLALLTACGGGSGGNGNSTSNNASTSSSSSTTISLTPITEKSAARLAGAFLDSLSLINESLRPNLEYDLVDGKKSGTCGGNTGSYEIAISDNGKKIIENYNNCRLLVFFTENTGKDMTLSGKQTRIRSTVNNQDSTQYSWDAFSLSDEQSKEIFHGTAELTTSTSRITTKINATVENSIQGKLVLNNVILESEKDSIKKSNAISKITNATGNINLENVASVNIQYITVDSSILLSGLGSSLKIYEEHKKLSIDLDSNNDGTIDAAVSLAPEIIDTLSETSQHTTIAPETINGITRIKLNSLKLKPFSLKEKFTHPSGHVLKIYLEFIEGNESDWQRIDATHFALKNPVSKEYTTYRFYAYAMDAFGNKSQKLDMDVHISADTDEDGEFDIYDLDDDNDGVNDRFDAFPLDPTESKDTDGDGIGDNKDPDIDNDNVANSEDAYPLDHNCSIVSEGDGKRCFQSIMSQHVLFVDKNGVFYIASISNILDGINTGKSDIIKWDSTTQKVIGVVEQIIPSASFNSIYVDNSHQFLFHIPSSNAIYSYSPITNKVEEFFQHEKEFHAFTVERGYLALTAIDSQNNFIYESYDADKRLISTLNGSVILNGNPTVIPFRSQALASFCKISIVLDENGRFVETGNREKRWQDPCNNGYEPFISLDSKFAALSGYEHYYGDSGIYNHSGEYLFQSNWDLKLHSAWSSKGFTHAKYVNGRYEINVINPYGQQLFRRELPEGDYGPDVYFTHGKIIVLSYQHNGGIRIGVYDDELNLINSN